MALARATLTTSIAAVYTSTNDSATTSIFFCNRNAAARTISIYLVPNSGTAGDTHLIVKDLSIDGLDTYILSAEKIVLANGDSIQAICSNATSVEVNISYVSI
jgi:hypothetical protein|tara:strand:- start:754 stop:1062 length:309 start_codon:yes stop_codon:yes gene_type:complete